MNQKTGIKTNLVEAVAINDAAFFEAPIIFMEPVPGSHSKGHHEEHEGITGDHPVWQMGRPRGTHNDYTLEEIQRLREYVVNRGGFLYILTHGTIESAMRPTYKVLRQILPEHQLTVIPNDHEIYRAYYSLNGPLRYPVRKMGETPLHFGQYSKQLQGIFIDGRLAILVDTEAMMHVLDGAVQKPFYGQYTNLNKVLEEYAPHAARQLINVVVYAVTHGKISDYSNYVPETALDNAGSEDAQQKAPPVTKKL